MWLYFRQCTQNLLSIVSALRGLPLHGGNVTCILKPDMKKPLEK